MNPHQRQQLEDRLRALPKAEQDRLFRQAAELRREEQKQARAERRRFADIDEPRPGGGRRKNDPVRMYVLKLLARELADKDHDAGVEPDPFDAAVGVAAQVGRRRCLVRPAHMVGSSDEPNAEPDTAAEDIECRLPAHLAGRQQSELCVGDRVTYRLRDDERRGGHELVQVLPRRTVLARRDPQSGDRRAIVANVDAIVVVVSVVSPPLHPRLIDRYLIAVEDSWVESTGGRHADDPDPAEAIIAVNKTDLLRGLPKDTREAELARLDPYRALGVPVTLCSTKDGSGIDELRTLLAGKVVAFVGHSGVGKSSLANALAPELDIRVGSIGAAANRGRHTTTTAQLHAVEAPGVEPFWIIDTPGVRTFGLDELTPAELRDAMPELRRLRRGCRFNDCTHTREPGCAVIAAVEAGELPKARYEAYRRLLDDITGVTRDEAIAPIRPVARGEIPRDDTNR